MHLFDCHEELNMKKMSCGYRFSLKPPAVVLKCKLDQNHYKPWGLNLCTEWKPACFKRVLFFLPLKETCTPISFDLWLALWARETKNYLCFTDEKIEIEA